MAHEHIVVFCTVPDKEKGAELGRQVVEERLAACVNLLDGLRSLYWWQGEVCDDPEALMVIKTRADGFEALRERLVDLHPYDTPEVVALPIVRGHPAYLAWIDDSLKSR